MPTIVYANPNPHPLTPYTCVASDPVFLNVPLLGRINWPVLVVVLFDPDEGLPPPSWFVMFMFMLLLECVVILLMLLVSVLLLLLLLFIARLELLRLLLLLFVSKCAALPGDMPRWLLPPPPPPPLVTELYGGGAGVAEGFAVLGGGNGGRLD